MLNFEQVRQSKMTMGELTAGLDRKDLNHLTNEMINLMLDLIADCVDQDVIFVPSDPEAYDPVAADEADIDLPWTLGHVIVHTTASAEEAAAIASELARGVPHRGGRSRSEVPWQTISTIGDCRQRLEESRRMRLASLDIWPDDPYLENTYKPHPDSEPINAVGRFVGGLRHDDSHLEQISKIISQAQAASGRSA